MINRYNYTSIESILSFIDIYRNKNTDFNDFLSGAKKEQWNAKLKIASLIFYIVEKYYDMTLTLEQGLNMLDDLSQMFPTMNFYHIDEYINNIGKLLIINNNIQ